MKTLNGVYVSCRHCRPWAMVAVLLAIMPLVSHARDVDEDNLRNLVLQDCGSCHGMTLRGGLGPALRPESLELLPVDAIAALIRDGVPGTAMPPWRALLTEPEIRWISERLKTGALVPDNTD